jgi:outer membrane protein
MACPVERRRSRLALAGFGCLTALAFLNGCRSTSLPDVPEASPAALLERITASPQTTETVEATVNRPRGPVAQVEPTNATDSVPVFLLTEAVDFGLRNNPRLRSAMASVDRAAGQEAVAFAPFLPQLDWYSRFGSSSPNLGAGAPGPVGAILPSNEQDQHTFAQAELGLQWTLWDFGRTRGRFNQAVSRRRITELQLGRARETVTFEVATAYVGVLLAQADRAVREQAIRQAQAILEDTRVRRRGGVADPDDVLRSEVLLAESRDLFVSAQQAELATLSRLNYAMGRNASFPLLVKDWKNWPRFAGSLTDCLQTAVAQRPEIGVAQEAVAVAQYGVQAANADFLPRLYIRSDVGNVSGSGVRTGWQGGAGIHLDQTLYAGGRRQGESQSAEADVSAAAASAQSIFDSISLEVNLAYRAQFAAYERIGLSEPAVRQARENLRLVTVKYKNGNATPTDIVDAETTATRAEQRYYRAIYDYLAALARLEYAMGTPNGCLPAQSPDETNEAELLPPPRMMPDEKAGRP